ncbi:RNA/RNP complex-1-interacting phosphatase-like [Mugil cephalus]|uniref:RNA/RNP complex-1-interacting phosphatase-like n=1 Tax=Mugil cephalus TaxID=48193 RepID=UPI001FB860F1|nr:RNA/RNP complex-1-interacting phosphatase-like [Mugil cephalus]
MLGLCWSFMWKLRGGIRNLRYLGAAEMSVKQKKKTKKKKSGVPDRWLNYCPVGRRIPGTRFIAFKVPLKPSLNRRVPESDSFGLWDLLDHVESQNQELGLIIDLTFTSRYYALADVPQSCSYIKILTEGHKVPSDAAILSFKRAVRHFLEDNRDNDQLIGVHCTHGLNRTGYLVCRYLIDVDGLEPNEAVELFNSCRGHRIERRNYLDDLQGGAKRSNRGIDEPEQETTRGLAGRDRRPINTSGQEGQPVKTSEQEGQKSVSTPRDERPPGDVPPETQQSDKRLSGNRRRRRARHRQRTDQASSDRCPPPPEAPPTNQPPNEA